MPSFVLTPVETRILGCLLEKERLTPENYPISLNSLTAGCNQTTNREPVTAYDVSELEEALSSLRDKKLVTVVFGAGSRVQKYRHNLLDHFNLDRREVALLAVLLLRGPQTPGELRARTERLHGFDGLQEMEACLDALCAGEDPLVRMLPACAGQKERRYVQLLSGEPEPANVTGLARDAGPVQTGVPAASGRIAQLEAELETIREEVRKLRDEFTAFRGQF